MTRLVLSALISLADSLFMLQEKSKTYGKQRQRDNDHGDRPCKEIAHCGTFGGADPHTQKKPVFRDTTEYKAQHDRSGRETEFKPKIHQYPQSGHDVNITHAVTDSEGSDDAQRQDPRPEEIFRHYQNAGHVAGDSDTNAEHYKLGQDHGDHEGIGDIGAHRIKLVSREKAVDYQPTK